MPSLNFSEGSGRVRVFSVKVGLVTLCNGKLVDKLRCKWIMQVYILWFTMTIMGKLADVFSLISDTAGCLVVSRFSEYLQEVLALPTMVLESQTFGFTEGLATTIFEGVFPIF